MRVHILFLAFSLTGQAVAADLLPYSQRTRAFSAFGTTVTGDLNAVGFAGATTGLGHSPDASFSNPAGLAMTFAQTEIGFVGTTVFDNHLQNETEPLRGSTALFASHQYPWGLAFGFNTPFSEGQLYQVGSDTLQTENITREFRASVAKVFWDNRVSLGASLILGQNTRSIGAYSETSLALGATLGALYQLPERILLGGTLTTPMTYGDHLTNTTPAIAMSQFFQEARSPWKISTGIGWIPNRIFQTGATLDWIGSQSNVALLSNNNVTVGEAFSLQPKLGVSYVFVDYKELRGQILAGTYLEFSRISGQPTRLHGTSSVVLQPWIFFLGWGFDGSAGYRNITYLAGLNIIKIFEKLDLVSKVWRPPSVGLFPDPFHMSDSGLSRALVKNWTDQGPKVDFLKESREFPKKLEKKIKSVENAVEGVSSAIQQRFENQKRKDPKKDQKPNGK